MALDAKPCYIVGRQIAGSDIDIGVRRQQVLNVQQRLADRADFQGSPVIRMDDDRKQNNSAMRFPKVMVTASRQKLLRVSPRKFGLSWQPVNQEAFRRSLSAPH
jgi:hypothetical protein